jgi:predicted CXXCH cytochrome family protein
MFQTLKLLPAHMGPFEGEVLGVLAIGVAGLAVLFVPFLDRGSRTRRLLNLLAVLTTAFFIVMTAWGWFSAENEVGLRIILGILLSLIVLVLPLPFTSGLIYGVVAGSTSLAGGNCAGATMMAWLPKQVLVRLALLAAPMATLPFGILWGQPVGEVQSVLPADYSCSLCHRKGGELWSETTPFAEEKDFADDIHWQKGLRCHDCHGGSPTLDQFRNHRDDSDFRRFRSPADIPSFCGHCHSSIETMRRYNPSARTDQETEYWTSGHGRRLKASIAGENVQPDAAVATCIDCHGGHGILSVNNVKSPVYPTRVAETCARCHSNEKVMASRTYNDRPLGHDQYQLWRQSVHAIALLEKGDLTAPACNDCHGNHGAMPPGVGSVANACGTCHGKVSSLFAGARMKHKFEEVGLPGCATCHGNHRIAHPDDEMLGMAAGAVCFGCHNPENPQYGATLAGAETARAMRARLEQLKHGIDEAERTVREAEHLGMEVRGPRFDLRQAFDALTNARTLVHSFNPEPIATALDQGLKVTSDVQRRANGALREYTYRRWWLAASLVPILLVVSLLLLYIRTLPLPADHS